MVYKISPKAGQVQFSADIMNENENFRGRSYSEWLANWCTWLLSDNPSYGNTLGEMLMTRGNLSYSYEKETGNRILSEEFLNRAQTFGESVYRGETISSDAPIFIQVMAAFFFVNDEYAGKALVNEQDCRRAAWNDTIRSGPIYAYLTREKDGAMCDLKDSLFLVESSFFRTTVTENSPLREKLQSPLEPGEYDGVITAYCAVVKKLDAGKYRLQFGGIGNGGYETDSIYDILVIDDTVEKFKEREIIPNYSKFKIQDRVGNEKGKLVRFGPSNIPKASTGAKKRT